MYYVIFHDSIFCPSLINLVILGPNPIFTKRGTITIRSLKSGMAHFNQDAPLDEYQQEQLKVIDDQSIG